jgi:hypothetical protein
VTTKAIRIDVQDETGAPLTGLSLAFDSAGSFYRVNGAVPATLPAVTELAWAPGRYTFTATLEPGEVLDARLDLGASSYEPRANITLTETELREQPTLDELVDALADRLATDHGAGTWGGAGGSGSQAVELEVVDENGDPLSGARVDVVDGAGAVKASGRTGTDGLVELLLDPGTYSARATLGGYGFVDTAIVVSSPDTVAPTQLEGTALPAAESGDVVGLTRALDLAATAAPNADGVSGLVAGDSVTLARTAANVPAGRTVAKVRATWKRPADVLGSDDDAVLQLEVTTAESAAGQVINAGAGGTAAWTVKLTPAQHLEVAAEGATDYDLQVTYDDDSVKTPEVGTWDAVSGRTSTAP